MLDQKVDPVLLVSALLYSAVGGYLDAYTYLAQGRVFANAQTGNIVLFAVNLATGNTFQAVHHLPPIAAYTAGFAVVICMNQKIFKQPAKVRNVAAIIELSVLLILTFTAHKLSTFAVVPMISFVAAVQHTSFNFVGDFKFNSAMTTGNLREATSGLTLWMMGCDPVANRKKFLILGSICLQFALGGLVGAIVTHNHPKHALAPAVMVVAAAALCSYLSTVDRQS